MVETSPGFSDGGGVGQHADSSLYLGEVAIWNNSWWLVVDTNFEPGGTPVDELNGSLGLDGADGCVHILGYNVSTVEKTTSHVLAVSGVAFDHLKELKTL